MRQKTRRIDRPSRADRHWMDPSGITHSSLWPSHSLLPPLSQSFQPNPQVTTRLSFYVDAFWNNEKKNVVPDTYSPSESKREEKRQGEMRFTTVTRYFSSSPGCVRPLDCPAPCHDLKDLQNDWLIASVKTFPLPAFYQFVDCSVKSWKSFSIYSRFNIELNIESTQLDLYLPAVVKTWGHFRT